MQINGSEHSLHVIHLTLGIAQVPCQSVTVAIEMTTCARDRAMSRQVGTVEKFAAGAHRRRFRIETYTDLRKLGLRCRIDNADRLIDAIQNIEPGARLIQGQSRRSGAHSDARLD